MSIEHKFGLMLASVFVNVISLGCAQYSLQEPTIIPTVQAQTQIQKVQTSHREPDVINVSTPQEIVDEMLELAKVTKNDVIYDLGSGDGRIPITAAQKYNARGVGIDINQATTAGTRKPRKPLVKSSASIVESKLRLTIIAAVQANTKRSFPLKASIALPYSPANNSLPAGTIIIVTKVGI
jgi:hypothetical protein